MTDSVSRTDQNGWTLLTLNRPAKLNALTVETFRELRRHVIDLRADDGVRCVVVRGAGKCFSAGHDLTAIAEGEDPPSPGWAALAEAGRAAPRDLAILKAQVGRLGRGVGEAAVQTHGGIGMTDELPIGHYLKRLLAIDAMFGQSDYHYRTVGAAASR